MISFSHIKVDLRLKFLMYKLSITNIQTSQTSTELSKWLNKSPPTFAILFFYLNLTLTEVLIKKLRTNVNHPRDTLSIISNLNPWHKW